MTFDLDSDMVIDMDTTTTTTTTKHTQQFDLYAAERKLRHPQATAAAVSVCNKQDVQGWLDRLTANEWWKERFPKVKTVEVLAIRSGRESVGSWNPDGVGVITMNEVHCTPQMLAHEIAHVCRASESTAELPDQGHDPAFARTYLELVYRISGSEAYTALRRLFVDHGICFDERCLYKKECECG